MNQLDRYMILAIQSGRSPSKSLQYALFMLQRFGGLARYGQGPVDYEDACKWLNRWADLGEDFLLGTDPGNLVAWQWAGTMVDVLVGQKEAA